jgi:predicted acetyltransferase/cyclopropane fatty-acyl-phospholipid synthase-like methyltransferase
MAPRFDFYGPQYARFGSDLAVALRREVYGEDLGQQGWRTVAEQAEIASLLGIGPESHVLDIACGSGGPSLALAERTRCWLTGLDAESAGIAFAQARVAERGLVGRVIFAVHDCAGPLPFAAGTFDSVVCIDAINHLPDRFAQLSEWGRVLTPGGRLLFTDPVVLTGPTSKSDLDLRAAAGFFLFVPPGVNEEAIQAAGLGLLQCEDRTAAVAEIAARWHAARGRHAPALEVEEGASFFEQRQTFLATTAALASSRRLSRFLYVAEKPAQPRSETLDPDGIALEAAGPKDAGLLANLLELYIHDLSAAFPGVEPGEDGRFGYDKLPLYWSEPERRFAFLIRQGARVAGFVLVRRGSPMSDDPDVHDVAEFFVLRAHRRSGVGRRAAFLLWNRLAGSWIVRVSEANRGALAFWTGVIDEYTAGAAKESTRTALPSAWRVFAFDTPRGQAV